MGLISDKWIEIKTLFFFFVIGRFVRLVRNLDVLERVYTIETQIMQIMDAIGIQNRVVVVNVVSTL